MFLIIAWHPATGKTTLGIKLKQLYPDHLLIHTDAYMEYGYKESLYMLIKDLEGYSFKNIIVEGIMGARLMRKLQEQGFNECVDLYLYLRGSLDLIKETYERERPGKNFDTLTSAIKWLDTVHSSIVLSRVPHLEWEVRTYDEELKDLIWAIPVYQK